MKLRENPAMKALAFIAAGGGGGGPPPHPGGVRVGRREPTGPREPIAGGGGSTH